MRACDCFIINHGYLANAVRLASELHKAGVTAIILSACGSPQDDHSAYASHPGLFTYPPNHYYGHLWNEALRMHDARTVGIVTSDATISDVPRLLARMHQAFDTFDNIWCYAPNVDFTPWRYRLDMLSRQSDDLYHVPTTDGICWFLQAELARVIGPMPLAVNHLGWGIDVLAGLLAKRAGKWVVRDYGITVQHPPGSGYARDDAARQELALAEHLGIAAEYRDYRSTAQSQLVERGWRFPAGGPNHVQQRVRSQVRRPQAF